MITSFQSLLLAIAHLMSLIIPILVALALLYFFWGLALFILKSGDEKTHIEGKNRMIWGVVALFVMVSVWGLVAAFQDNLLGGSAPTTIPINSKSLPSSSGSSVGPAGSSDEQCTIPCGNPDEHPECPGLQECL